MAITLDDLEKVNFSKQSSPEDIAFCEAVKVLTIGYFNRPAPVVIIVRGK